MNFKKPWTDAEVARIFELRENHYTAAEIAEQLGRTKSSVDCKFRELKRTKRSPARDKANPELEIHSSSLK